ncbi:MAG: DUF3618 domain-containing protein [Rubrobacteraceae bacterium]
MDDRPDQLRGQDMPSEGARGKLSRERAEINPNPSATDDELEELRQELARTRAEMSETVYALQGRLNPQYVREQASSQAKDTAKQAGSNVADTIKDNPIPAALAGAGLVGLGWLIASGRDSGSQRGSREDSGASNYYDSRRSYYRSFNDEAEFEASSGGSGGEKAQEAAGQAREKAGELGGQLQGRASQAGDEAREKAQRAKGGLQRTLQETPLALGALALGIGAAVGFAIPGTSKEDEMMGETRDNLVEQGKRSARETRERAQSAIEEGRRAAEQEADRQDLT